MKVYAALFFILLLAACGPQPTPLPAFVPTSTPEPVQPTLPPPLRYAAASNTASHIDAGTTAAIMAEGLLEYLPEFAGDDGLGVDYDLVMAYGLWEGWTAAPLAQQVTLIINTALPPLDRPELAAIVSQFLRPQQVVDALGIPAAAAAAHETQPPAALRTALANAGYPDGFELVLAHTGVPGAEQLVAQLAEGSIDLQVLRLSPEGLATALTEGYIHLALLRWLAPDEREAWATTLPEAKLLDLYSLPISYRAVEGLAISFSPAGWPLATRQTAGE